MDDSSPKIKQDQDIDLKDLNQKKNSGGKKKKVWLKTIGVAILLAVVYFAVRGIGGMFSNKSEDDNTAVTSKTESNNSVTPSPVVAKTDNTQQQTPPPNQNQPQTNNNVTGQDTTSPNQSQQKSDTGQNINQQTNNSAGNQGNQTVLTLAMGNNFIFANGENGFNFCIKKENLTDSYSGDFGATVNGDHYVTEAVVNKYRPNANATKVRFGGKVTANEKGIWVFKDMILESGFYVYKAGQTAFDENGNSLFCIEYCTSDGKTTRRYLPHEAVKRGIPFNSSVM